MASVSGLFAALAGWRTVAVCLAQMPDDQAREEAGTVLQTLPGELRSYPAPIWPTRWITDPVGLRRISEAAAAEVDRPAGSDAIAATARRSDIGGLGRDHPCARRAGGAR